MRLKHQAGRARQAQLSLRRLRRELRPRLLVLPCFVLLFVLHLLPMFPAPR